MTGPTRMELVRTVIVVFVIMLVGLVFLMRLAPRPASSTSEQGAAVERGRQQ